MNRRYLSIDFLQVLYYLNLNKTVIIIQVLNVLIEYLPKKKKNKKFIHRDIHVRVYNI